MTDGLSKSNYPIIPNIYITKESIDNFSAISQGKLIWKVRLREERSHLPQTFVFKQMQDTHLHENELRNYYELLETLQGTVVSSCYGEVLWDDGFEIRRGIALEFCGNALSVSMTKGMNDQQLVSLALQAYSAILRVTQECHLSWEDDVLNIVVGDKGQIRLIDFGMSRKIVGVRDVVHNFLSMNHILVTLFRLEEEEEQGDSTVLGFKW